VGTPQRIAAPAGPVCSNTITNYSATFGKRDTTKLERFSNQTSQWLAKGPITKVNAYYNPSSKCVVGVKITYGKPPHRAIATLGLVEGRQAEARKQPRGHLGVHAHAAKSGHCFTLAPCHPPRPHRAC
jgi:hypothetical protein